MAGIDPNARRECERWKGNGLLAQKGRLRVAWISWHDSPYAVRDNGSKPLWGS